MVIPPMFIKVSAYKGLSRGITYNQSKMKNNILIEHLANADLSFLKVVKDEVAKQNGSGKEIVPKAIRQTVKTPQKNWSNDIAELENYFASIELPTQPVKLNRCSTIIDCSLFIESHFAHVKANNGKRTFLPYLNRLQELKQVLTINSN